MMRTQEGGNALSMNSIAHPMPKKLQSVLRITGALSLILFLIPAAYALVYFLITRPHEEAEASKCSIRYGFYPSLGVVQTLAQEEPADRDLVIYWQELLRKSHDPRARVVAIDALSLIVSQPRFGVFFPFESISIKTQLSNISIAERDKTLVEHANRTLTALRRQGVSNIR